MSMKESIHKRRLNEDNIQECKVIKHLEKVLKLKKRGQKRSATAGQNSKNRKNSHHMFIADGLDYILDITDPIGENADYSISDTEDISSKMRKKTKNVFAERSLSVKCHDMTTVECFEMNIRKADPSNNSRKCDDCFDDHHNETFPFHQPNLRAVETKNEQENHGQLKKEKGNINEADVSVKFKMTSVAITGKQNLQNRLKGLLNRLSESNMNFVLSKIEDMFMDNSRNDMVEALFFVMKDFVIAECQTPTRLIMVNVVLIALLHANIGPDIGIFFLQKLAVLFHDLSKPGENYGEGKQRDNLLFFVALLYNFKVCNYIVVIDIMKDLINSFQEKDIELILLFLKCVGFRLRKQNPLKLKEIINLIQVKAHSLPVEHNRKSSRIQFVLDMTVTICNNNKYKLSSPDDALIGQLHKVLKCHLRPGKSVQELAVSYDQLLETEKKSRWSEIPSCIEKRLNYGPDLMSKPMQVIPEQYSSKVVELAKRLHMNTEIRKKVFYIIITSEDYLDAFEKLLFLKGQHEEIISVIVYSMLQEKAFNQFYSFLTGKLCSFSKKFRVSLQFLLWDQFRELDKLTSCQIKIMAGFLAQLFLMKDLPISVLKVIHFSEMNRHLAKFIRHILLKVLLHNSEEECVNVFSSVSSSKNLALFRAGLSLFMHHFLLQDFSSLDVDISERLKERIKLCEKALNVHKKL